MRGFSECQRYKFGHDKSYLYAESLTMTIWFYFSATHRCYKVEDICKNGGTCQPDGHNYTCNCTEFWKGDHCEIGESILLLLSEELSALSVRDIIDTHISLA